MNQSFSSTEQSMTLSPKFWETKSLAQMNQAEWEAVCDGCGLCCLTKLQDEETDEIVYTRVVCAYSDIQTGQCNDYANRFINVPSCVQLTLSRVEEFDWLPVTCAYRMLANNQPLADWHPLVSGNSHSLKTAHIGLAAIPVVVDNGELDYEDFLIESL